MPSLRRQRFLTRVYVQARVRELKAEGRSADEAAAAVQAGFQARYPQWLRFNGLGPAARAAYAELP